MIVCEPQDELRAFLESRLAPLTQEAAFVGRRSVDGGLLGVVGFDHWTESDVELIYAGEPGWITPTLARVVFAYVFDGLGCTRCTGRITADDEYALSLSKRMGFSVEGRLREACKGLDVLIVGMLKQECRFYGQEIHRAGQKPATDQPAATDRSAGPDEPGEHVGSVRQSDLRRGSGRPLDVHDRAIAADADRC